MTEVQPGDVIFSAVKQKIVAVSVANSAAYDAPRPSGFEGELWEANGWRVDLRLSSTTAKGLRWLQKNCGG
jgi:hypothetical protein